MVGTEEVRLVAIDSEVNARHVCGECGHVGIKVVSTRRVKNSRGQDVVIRFRKCQHCGHRPPKTACVDDGSVNADEDVHPPAVARDARPRPPSKGDMARKKSNER